MLDSVYAPRYPDKHAGAPQSHTGTTAVAPFSAENSVRAHIVETSVSSKPDRGLRHHLTLPSSVLYVGYPCESRQPSGCQCGVLAPPSPQRATKVKDELAVVAVQRLRGEPPARKSIPTVDCFNITVRYYLLKMIVTHGAFGDIGTTIRELD